MSHQTKVLDGNNLQPNTHSTNGVSWAPLAMIDGCKVEYVKWERGTIFPGHENLEPTYVYVISGELLDGESVFPAKTLITFPAGYIHHDYRTETGAEFILIWRGRESVRYLDV